MLIEGHPGPELGMVSPGPELGMVSPGPELGMVSPGPELGMVSPGLVPYEEVPLLKAIQHDASNCNYHLNKWLP